jgi:hypothetical protein
LAAVCPTLLFSFSLLSYLCWKEKTETRNVEPQRCTGTQAHACVYGAEREREREREREERGERKRRTKGEFRPSLLTTALGCDARESLWGESAGKTRSENHVETRNVRWQCTSAKLKEERKKPTVSVKMQACTDTCSCFIDMCR